MTQTKTSLRPLGNRVLLSRSEQEEKLQGGIILPDSAKKKQETAEVIAVGTGKRLDNGETLPVPVNVGDTVLMDKYAGQEVEIDGEEFVIIDADSIVAIISK